MRDDEYLEMNRDTDKDESELVYSYVLLKQYKFKQGWLYSIYVGPTIDYKNGRLCLNRNI